MARTKQDAKVTNAYKKARLEAAKGNAELSTVEKASLVLGINREKLGQIEQEDSGRQRCQPNADEVAAMIRTYHAPELANHFCTTACPLGAGQPMLQHEDLNAISVQLILAVKRIGRARTSMETMLEDGRIDEEERKRFLAVLENLKILSKQTASLELWAKKNDLL